MARGRPCFLSNVRIYSGGILDRPGLKAAIVGILPVASALLAGHVSKLISLVELHPTRQVSSSSLGSPHRI